MFLEQSSTSSPEGTNHNKTNNKPAWKQALAMIFSQRAAARTFQGHEHEKRWSMQFYTAMRVTIPSFLAGVAATFLFPALAMGMATLLNVSAGGMREKNWVGECIDV